MSLLTWKIKRELNRIRQQLKGIPEFFVEPLQRRRHDAQRGTMLEAAHGQIAQGPKIALLLLYQPKGISDATLWTCQHLVAKGYAPLIISNAPLNNEDRIRLSTWTWRMADRPNFGYDFGGYRDGIWLLWQWKVDPDVLIILNDSIWFPLNSEETLIDRMEDSSAQFVGALQLDPLRQTDGLPAKKRPFFGSFFLMFKQGAWQHPAFQRFWANYRITSNKYKTIRRGERGMSHALMDAGLHCKAIYTRTALDTHIRQLDTEGLRQLLGDLVTIDKSLENALRHCGDKCTDTPSWRAQAIELALQVTEKQNVLATAPITSMTVFEVPYLKKSRDWNNLKALRLIHDRIRDGRLPAPHTSIAVALEEVL
jgi:hypothetical protein